MVPTLMFAGVLLAAVPGHGRSSVWVAVGATVVASFGWAVAVAGLAGGFASGDLAGGFAVGIANLTIGLAVGLVARWAIREAGVARS